MRGATASTAHRASSVASLAVWRLRSGRLREFIGVGARKKRVHEHIRRTGFAVIGLLAFGQVASASTWSAISFSATPQNAPQVQAAADTLMSSAAGKEFPGKLLLQVEIADGASPATHSFIPIYKSAAQREAFVQKLQADPAWSTFLGCDDEADPAGLDGPLPKREELGRHRGHGPRLDGARLPVSRTNRPLSPRSTRSWRLRPARSFPAKCISPRRRGRDHTCDPFRSRSATPAKRKWKNGPRPETPAAIGPPT